MKFAMYNGFIENVRDVGIERAAEKALQLGFSSVEVFADLVSGNRNPIDDLTTAANVRKTLDQYGLTVSCYSVYADLWRNPTGESELKRHVRMAAVLGSPYIHHTLLPWLVPPETMPTSEVVIQDVAEAAVRIADYAATMGITCIYEIQGYYVNGVKGFRLFWDKVKSQCDNVGICGDLGNALFVNEKPENFLAEFASDICHVHVKDYQCQRATTSPGRYWTHAIDDIWLRDSVVGNGVVDFRTCLSILKDSGYDGCFALENGHPEPFEEGVHQAMAHLLELW